jgi:chromate transporter
MSLSRRRSTSSAPPAGTTDLPGGSRTDLRGVLVRWGRLGILGVGGPQAHTALLREMMVDRERWLTAREFQDAVAATSLLPGPASTQLAIFCARSVAGIRGALVGGLAFILPGFVLIVALAALFLAHGQNDAVRGASAGAAAAVVVVVALAGIGFARGFGEARGGPLVRSVLYAMVACFTTIFVGPWVLAVLLASGLAELALRLERPAAIVWIAGGAKIPALVWTAFKVGGLSFGGGLVIIPLMQHDVVHAHHWLTAGQFSDAVAFGQLTPGPVVLTVSVVGYAVSGVAGAALAAVVAFAPSFAMVLAGAPFFDQLRTRPGPQAFLGGAGPAAVGAIFGAAVLLAPQAGKEWWQGVVVAAAILAALLGRSSFTILALGLLLGLLAAVGGLPLPR